MSDERLNWMEVHRNVMREKENENEVKFLIYKVVTNERNKTKKHLLTNKENVVLRGAQSGHVHSTK